MEKKTLEPKEINKVGCNKQMKVGRIEVIDKVQDIKLRAKY